MKRVGRFCRLTAAILTAGIIFSTQGLTAAAGTTGIGAASSEQTGPGAAGQAEGQVGQAEGQGQAGRRKARARRKGRQRAKPRQARRRARNRLRLLSSRKTPCRSITVLLWYSRAGARLLRTTIPVRLGQGPG